ncbi:arf-GAP with Rho-GAP domain, ANK repeat and PH domain-containing protein 1-like [Centroberyx affinis]|uniref:arf-GAP with Rho-GAP domain, ANK repeat and PH domain-containing protein 1-like n=1 Tax=Centroberyx affinis TaxID=166261 RepID=UPI003A5C52E1
MSPPPPVPKPRARYRTEGLSVSSDRDLTETLQPASANGLQRSTDEDLPPLPAPVGPDRGFGYPGLSGLTDIISANIPGLAGVAGSIPAPASAPPPPASAPPPPPGLDSMAYSIATHIPSLAGAASAVANPALFHPATSPPCSGTASPHVASLDNIVSSLATNIPSLAGIVSCVANPAVSPGAGAASPVSSMMIPGAVANPATAMFHHGNLNHAVTMTTPTPPSAPPPAPPSAPPTTAGKHRPPSLTRLEDSHTDVEALSRAVLAALDPTAASSLSPPEGATCPMDEASCPSPTTIKGENPYITVLAHWGSQEEVESESSNEEEDTGVGPASSGGDGPMEGDLAPNHTSNANNITASQSGRVVPCRPAPPPPRPASQGKPLKQKTPRAATIRVSRKKGSGTSSNPQSAVVRASWLDVWKGFRHNVVWATLDGQLMSLWKKRTDRFSEVLFHVSSITNVKKQDKGRFSVYFKKKHYDFMAHNDDVQDGWVTSLLACRGQPSPAPPELHGPITIKDPRSRIYAAVWGHNLWIYDNKEGFQLGVASFSVPLNVASVKSTGKHSFTLITPYKSFSLSVDSSKDRSAWLARLSSSIRGALSCSRVALRLWENPFNKLCGDCGSAHPEWASVNLLLVVCEACAGQHRSLGSSRSKIRSLTLDNKVWTEPLIQLFVTYGNRLANQVWSPAVPAAEQLRPESSDQQRSEFILNKYSRGRYRRPHPLACSHTLLHQRLCEVVCGDDVEETMALLCSGAKVCPSDPQSPAPLQLAERAGQALQAELLRHNEYTDVPPYLPQSANRRPDSASPGEEEELHGKLEEDRFLFSLENDSAACDVLDLREVLSVFLRDGPGHEFEMVTLTDRLSCAADTQEALLSHLVHILKVILPGGVSEREVGGALAVSKVCVMEVGGASEHSDAWLVLWVGGVTVYPAHNQTKQTLRTKLDTLTRYGKTRHDTYMIHT